jgi:uncharacterized lipoprotein YajG
MQKIPKSIVTTLVSLFLLSACSSSASPTSSHETAMPTMSVVETVATESVPTPGVDECVVCHTDKQTLIDTAKPEEEAAESESKGVG